MYNFDIDETFASLSAKAGAAGDILDIADVVDVVNVGDIMVYSCSPFHFHFLDLITLSLVYLLFNYSSYVFSFNYTYYVIWVTYCKHSKWYFIVFA